MGRLRRQNLRTNEVSVVTNICMLSHIDDQEKFAQLNERLGSRYHLRRVIYECGGTKYLEMDVWTGAFNHFHLPDLINAISKTEFCNETLAFVAEQDDDAWRQVWPVK